MRVFGCVELLLHTTGHIIYIILLLSAAARYHYEISLSKAFSSRTHLFMGCTGSKQADTVLERPPEIDVVKARENAVPISATVYAFGKCPDKAQGKQKKYLIFYLVRVNLVDPDTNMSFTIVVYRRFSQFELFRNMLLKSKKYENIEALPKKKMFGKTNTSIDHLCHRQTMLNTWLTRIVQMDGMLQDPICVSFLTEEADVKPEDLSVQTTEPFQLEGEEIDGSVHDECDGGSEEARNRRAVSGAVFAMGRCLNDNDNQQKKNLVYFAIRVKLEDNGMTSQVIVYRRFSQFETFRSRLMQSKIYVDIPQLPKKLIGKMNRNENALFNRQTDLESWLRSIGQLPGIVEDVAYQQFLTEDAGDEPCGFQYIFHDPSIVGRLSDDDSSDEDSEEEDLTDDDVSVEVIVKGAQKNVDSSPRLAVVNGSSPARSPPAVAMLPPPPSEPLTTFSYQTIDGFGSGLDTTKRKKDATCIYYAIRVHSSTVGIKGVHEFHVYRRFSEFEKFRRELLATKMYDSLPNLPKKKVFGNTSSNTGFMMNRKKELMAWLRHISDTIPAIRSDPLYARFLSEHPNNEPENYCAHGTFVMF